MQTQTPTIEQLLHSPAASNWLKRALEESLRRDPVDAANDAELLSAVLNKRADDSLAVLMAATKANG